MKLSAGKLGFFAAGLACATTLFAVSGWWTGGSDAHSPRASVSHAPARTGGVSAAELAALLARPLQTEPDAMASPSRSAAFAGISMLAAEADQLGARGGELAPVAATFAKVLRDFESLAAEAPSVQPLIRSGLDTWKASLDESDGEFVLGLLSISSEYSVLDQYIDQLSAIHDRVVACRIQVAATAMRRPVTTKAQPLQAIFQESTGLFSVPNDVLTLTNTTGHALHHAMVWVELSGRSGEIFSNLYYADQWEPSQALLAVCGSDRPARETVHGVRQVRYRLVADELSGPIGTLARSN